MTQTLTVAVCICDGVTLSDFIPPTEILSALDVAGSPLIPPALLSEVKYRLAIDYVAPAKKPVRAMGNGLVTVNPTHTYSEVLSKGVQYDILWIPAGPAPDLTAIQSGVPKEQIDFIRKQAAGAKYVMSVCGGSVQLATAGVLEGKRATTNKLFFKLVVSQTSDKIQWVAKARWVVDGNIWTSSGVSAGSDMALAFLEHLAGRDLAQLVRGSVEIPEVNNSEDDPFAAFHNLV